jgi:hypothetical protein
VVIARDSDPVDALPRGEADRAPDQADAKDGDARQNPDRRMVSPLVPI